MTQLNPVPSGFFCRFATESLLAHRERIRVVVGDPGRRFLLEGQLYRPKNRHERQLSGATQHSVALKAQGLSHPGRTLTQDHSYDSWKKTLHICGTGTVLWSAVCLIFLFGVRVSHVVWLCQRRHIRIDVNDQGQTSQGAPQPKDGPPTKAPRRHNFLLTGAMVYSTGSCHIINALTSVPQEELTTFMKPK